MYTAVIFVASRKMWETSLKAEKIYAL